MRITIASFKCIAAVVLKICAFKEQNSEIYTNGAGLEIFSECSR